MDLIFTNKNRLELGVLHNFDVDFDTTSEKDFQIDVSIKNNILEGGFYWYIEGTEYGGRIDKMYIDTESDTISYTGRNWRGLLGGKIIEPPSGLPHYVISGTIHDIVYKLIEDAGLLDLFAVDVCEEIVIGYKFYRYVTLYDGLMSLTRVNGLVPSFKMLEDGKVHISFSQPTDYTKDNEYTEDDLFFTITKTYGGVNHLICLGQGEMTERQVVHLYADENGNISKNKSIYGIDEVVEVYENTGAEDVESLEKEGISHFKEIRMTDSFEVSVPDISLKIGDIIGGYETITKTYVASEIANAIVKIDDDGVRVEFKVGNDETSGISPQAGTVTSQAYGLSVDEDGNLFVYYQEGTTIPQFELDSSGDFYVTSENTFEYDSTSGYLFEIKGVI